MKKKVLAALLAGAMVIGLLAGCGSTAANTASEPAEETKEEAPAAEEVKEEAPAATAETEPAEEPAEEPASEPAVSGVNPADIKLGVIFYSKEDNLGQCVYNLCNHAAEVIGCQIQWAVGSLSAEEQLTDAENLVSAGCNGILCIPMSDAVNLSMIKLCEENEVYYSVCYRDIPDEEVKAACEASPWYASNCFEDEITAGKKLVNVLIDEGRKNLCAYYISPSTALRVRNDGIDLGMEEAGLKFLGTYTNSGGDPVKEASDAVSNFLQLYPECDGICAATAAVGAGEAVLNTLRSLRKPGECTYATFDVWEGMAQDFEDGYLSATCAGMSYDSLFSFIALYNYCAGMPMTDGTAHLYWQEIVVDSPEACANFEKYIDQPDVQIFSDDIIRSLVGASEQDFNDLMGQFDMDWVMEQMG